MSVSLLNTMGDYCETVLEWFNQEMRYSSVRRDQVGHLFSNNDELQDLRCKAIARSCLHRKDWMEEYCKQGRNVMIFLGVMERKIMRKTCIVAEF